MKHVRKSKTGVSLAKNSIVCFVMLVLIVLTTTAWFTLYDTSEALEVYVGSDTSDVSVSFALPNDDGSAPTENSAYFSNLDFEKITSLTDTFQQEVTGDGIDFIIPSFTEVDGELTVDKEGAWTKATPNQDYLSLTFYVRSPEKNLYISQNSYLDTGDLPLTATLADGTTDSTDVTNLINKSGYGDFSQNGIAGAVRVALLDITNHTGDLTIAGNRKMLWIPRPDLKLENTDGLFTLKKGVTNDNPDEQSLTNTYRHAYYDVPDAQAGKDEGVGLYEDIKYPDAASVVTSAVNQSNPDLAPLLSGDFDLGTGGNEVTMEGRTFYLYKYTLNMWIEGLDTEASSALNGGQFKLILNFTSKKV